MDYLVKLQQITLLGVLIQSYKSIKTIEFSDSVMLFLKTCKTMTSKPLKRPPKM